jgi:hypothetical protein
MSQIGCSAVVCPREGVESPKELARSHTVLLVSGDNDDGHSLAIACEFLSIGIEHETSGVNLARRLRASHPIAVFADLVGEAQDGCHVLMVAAEYDRSLPVLLFGDDDPALLGAVDAVRQVWSLTHVTTTSKSPCLGALVEFLCHAVESRERHAT